MYRYLQQAVTSALFIWLGYFLDILKAEKKLYQMVCLTQKLKKAQIATFLPIIN